ncbi:MAG: bifunctional 2-C-methyl-D-erythritol 4-phosphate cytidylyltransferase/2-C-methyl-D-erythritol 2,4-cyclodiphosphate synthase [Alphaproteobacteria bacterium]
MISDRVVALVVAAGRGSRAGSGGPKQYRDLAGKSVLFHSVTPFLNHGSIAAVHVVIHADDHDLYAKATVDLARLGEPIIGGATRQASVRLGLEAVIRNHPEASLVLIHDAARPFVTTAVIDRVIAGARSHGAAVPAVAVIDTIKRIDETGRVIETPPRSALRAVQTPQGFAIKPLLAAHRAAPHDDFTDDAAVMEHAGHAVTVVEGDRDNIKLTSAEDIEAAKDRLKGTSAMTETRVGQGYDVHAFGPGDHVMLGGIRVPHDQGVLAHSDGDVVLHALTDAVLGAIADGDIGTHFPPSDEQWRGASSDRFLAHAVKLTEARGGKVIHADVTVVCEAPRIGAYRDAMRARIGAILGLPVDRVGLKATTSERMGFTGRREGLAALAVVTVQIPGGDLA